MDNFFAGKSRSDKDHGVELEEQAESLIDFKGEQEEEVDAEVFDSFGFEHEKKGEDPKSDEVIEKETTTNKVDLEDGGSDDFEINEETTHFAIIAHEWKSKGILPEDVEIKNDLSSDEVQELYLKAMESTSRSLVRSELEDKVRSKGIDPKSLFDDESDDEVLLKQFDTLSKLKWSDMEEDENFDDNMRHLAKLYVNLAAPKLSKEQKEGLVESEFNNNHPEDLFKKYIDFFKDQKSEKQEVVDANKLAQKEKKEKEAKENRTLFLDKIEERYGMDKDKAKEFYSKIFDKKHIHTDKDGNKRKVSLFQKKRSEMANDPDMLLDFADFILNGTDKKTITKKAKKEGQTSLMQKMAEYQASNNGKVTKRESRSSNSSSSDSIFEDI